MKSTVTDIKYCFFCGDYASGEHHLIFGTSGRKFAEDNGLKVPICAMCHTMGSIPQRIHDNPKAEQLSKMLGQAIYERNEALKGASLEDIRKRFIKQCGNSYL